MFCGVSRSCVISKGILYKFDFFRVSVCHTMILLVDREIPYNHARPNYTHSATPNRPERIICTVTS